MGKLLIKGIDVNNYIGELYNNNDARTKASSAIGVKLRGFNNEIDNQSKKAVCGDLYDVFENKLKYNGSIITIAPRGTRPINENEHELTSDNFTRFLVNKDGQLILSAYSDGSSGTILSFVPKSTEKNRKLVITLAMWGAGGRGGGGSYFSFVKPPAGNYGGIGGEGAGKAFLKIQLDNNSYCRIEVPDASLIGRYRHSDTEVYKAISLALYDSEYQKIVQCNGGYSGIGSHMHSSQDSTIGNSYASVEFFGDTITNTYEKNGMKCTLCMSASGGVKTNNGNGGSICTFKEITSSRYGNPEDRQGALCVTGNGGASTGVTYDNRHGSGGGGSYGYGGNSGDTGNGSGGSPGARGGGGGGSGSPNFGIDGGEGGYAGFTVFY